MSYYNYIYQLTTLSPIEVRDLQYNEEYTMFDESDNGFDLLKEQISKDYISHFPSGKEVIVFKEILGGSDYIRPSMLQWPENCFYGWANCVMKVVDMDKNLCWSDLSCDINEIESALESYTKHLTDENKELLYIYRNNFKEKVTQLVMRRILNVKHIAKTTIGYVFQY